MSISHQITNERGDVSRGRESRSAPSAEVYIFHRAIIEGFSDCVLARIYVSDRDDPTGYPGFPMPYPCFIHASRMLHPCFTHTSRMLYGCLPDASRLEYSGTPGSGPTDPTRGRLVRNW
jgi:hypothetical protein